MAGMPGMPQIPSMPAGFQQMPGLAFPPVAPGIPAPQTMPDANGPGSLSGMMKMGPGGGAGIEGFQQFLAQQGGPPAPGFSPAPTGFSDGPLKRQMSPDERGEEDISVEERRAI